MRRLLVRTVLVALLASVVLAGALVWRLSRGPIPLDLLTPRIQAALSPAGAPVAIRIGGTALAWDGPRRDVVLRLRDVVLANAADGAEVGAMPALNVRLSARALLGGRIAPRRITLVGPTVRLVRQTDGTIDLGLGTGTQPLGDDLSLHELADGVFGRHDVGAGSVQLQAVGVEEGAVTLVDLVSGRTWSMPRVDVAVRPEDDGVTGTLEGVLAMPGGDDVPVSAGLRYQRQPEQVTLTATVRDLVPAHIDVAPPAASRLAFPLDGTATLTYDATLQLTQARLVVTGGEGSLDVAGTPLALTRLTATADLDPIAGTARVDELEAELDGTVVAARLRVDGVAGDGRWEAEARLGRVAVAALPRWWPAAAAPDARAWVTTNVTAGTVRDLAVRSSGTVRDADPATVTTAGLTGSGAFDGLTVRYADTMPPATGVGGTITLAPAGLGFRVARGSVAGVEVVRATVDVPLGATGTAPPRLPITVAMRGPLGATLAVLDRPPLGLARAIGIPPADARGTVTGTLALGVPLAGPITAQALGVRVTADVKDGAVPRLVRGLDVSAAQLHISRDDTAVVVRGPVRLGGVAATLDWQEDQTDRAADRRRVDVQGRIDDAGWTALGIDTYGLVSGPIGVHAIYVEPRSGQASVTVDGDLTAATVDLQLLDFTKAAGRPGQAHAMLRLRSGVVVGVDGASLQAGGSRVEAKATRSDDGRRWLTADATAKVAPSAPGETSHRFTLALRPDGARNRFTFTCDDAGAFFRGIGSFGDAEGGQLTATGTIDLQAPSPPPFDATVSITKFTLTREPIVTKVAQLTSLSGIASSLRGGGLYFDRLACDLSQKGHVVTLANGVADGPSLAISIHGTVDRRTREIAMTGTLVPAYYGLNTAAGKIPVLGRLLTGGDKSGIQVFDFTAKGQAGDPTVSANVSSLAPGVLRDLVRRLTR